MQKGKKFAYAASFGNSFLADEYDNIYKDKLQDFTAIGIREKSGLTVLKQLGLVGNGLRSYIVVGCV